METYDFAIGWTETERKEDLFINTLESECKLRKLSFISISDKSLDTLTSKIKKGDLKIKFYFDMASETYKPNDNFIQFAYCLKDSGTRIVADPDNVKAAADKAITHFDLISSRVPVPHTVMIRNWESTRRLTEDEKKRLGFPFVIKPARGYAQKGVKIIDEQRPLKDVADARKIAKGDNFLLQEFIEPQALDGSLAWFRVFHVFGEIIPCWWHPETKAYRQVTLKEIDDYQLMPLVRITAEIARIARVDFFSCEIAISKKNKKFVVIDYMNDQCAVDPQSEYKDGVPDDLVIHMAERIVEKAWQYIKGKYTLTYRALWFPRIKVKDEDV
ncbi:MAG: hypothetical protein HQ572_04950 [Candidatus Omnitrophica bacterium]|nr:hypothetical protein [Candidatus Omnitrophota bacterium]